MNILSAISNSLLAAVGMFWSIFWALVLGFTISGVIQAFVSKKRMAELLGKSGIRELGLATFFGTVSSSCSFAAASMSRNLFEKGAHIIPSLAFMMASTNLVVELGIILWLMMGWQFVAAEFVGGVILVLIMSILMRFFGPLEEFEEKRRELNKASLQNQHSEAQVKTLEGWQMAAANFVIEWRMIWKDILLGVVISGFLMVLMPQSFWQRLFLHSDLQEQFNLVRIVENALVGPLISVISFVCSVGNIPLANVLYNGGITFGGAVSFIFADLIVIPLILIYRKYYGWKLALWITGIFYISMAGTGIIIDILFTILGLIPKQPAPMIMHEMHVFQLNYTFWLNIIFLILAVILWGLSRRAKSHVQCCH